MTKNFWKSLLTDVKSEAIERNHDRKHFLCQNKSLLSVICGRSMWGEKYIKFMNESEFNLNSALVNTITYNQL